jgi:hypothetical protein
MQGREEILLIDERIVREWFAVQWIDPFEDIDGCLKLADNLFDTIVVEKTSALGTTESMLARIGIPRP